MPVDTAKRHKPQRAFLESFMPQHQQGSSEHSVHHQRVGRAAYVFVHNGFSTEMQWGPAQSPLDTDKTQSVPALVDTGLTFTTLCAVLSCCICFMKVAWTWSNMTDS